MAHRSPFLRKEEEFRPRDPTVHQPELSEDNPEIKRDTQNHWVNLEFITEVKTLFQV